MWQGVLIYLIGVFHGFGLFVLDLVHLRNNNVSLVFFFFFQWFYVVPQGFQCVFLFAMFSL